MTTHLQLTHEPLAIQPPTFPAASDSGAWVDFFGVVRGQEHEREIAALDYEAYEAMALRELERIVTALGAKHPVQEVWLTHRLGCVPVGEPSLHVRVRSAHRAEALAFTGELIDEMKRSVPIWKGQARQRTP